MEIYKNLDTPQNKKFQDLLNSETAKNKIGNFYDKVKKEREFFWHILKLV